MDGFSSFADRPPRIRAIVDSVYYATHSHDPNVEMKIIEPGRYGAPPVPQFLAGDIDAALAEQIYGVSAAEAVCCVAIKDGMIGPTGIAISGRTALYSEIAMQPAYHVRRIVESLLSSDLPVRQIAGAVAVIYGPAHQTWGHWVCDYLPRLHVLARAGFDLEALKFVVPPDLKPFEERLLDGLGISGERRIRYAYGKEVLQADMVILPSGFRSDDRLNAGFADATRFWISQLAGAPPVADPVERIFISRAGAPGERVMHNRSVIEAIASARGFRIISPETLDIAEQLRIFSRAKILVGEYGSAMHNSVFAPRSAKICVLRGTSRHPGFVQTGLCTAMGQRIGYVFGDTRAQNVEQRFRIEPGVFERALSWLECGD